MFIVEEYFDGELVKEHKFFTSERALAFFERAFELTKNTYFVRYYYRGLVNGISKQK
jgi:hypothetical protein